MITATPRPDGGVDLVLVGVTAGTYITRDTGNGPEPVRVGVDLAAGDHTLVDYECPFGVLALYETTPDGFSDTTRVDSDYPRLSHPYLPLSLAVTIGNDSPTEWETPGTVHVPVDGGDVVATYVPRRVVRGNLRIPVADADIPTLSALFVDGAPLLLRTPPGCPVTDRWVWVDRLTRNRDVPDGSLSWIDAPYTRVAAPGIPETSPPPWTWDQVPITYPTWADVVDATWTDLLLGPGIQAQAAWSF